MEEKNVCGICQGGCHVVTDIEDGCLKGVRVDKDSPLGRLCSRGAIAPQILYGDQRIKHPLIRTGERGEGKFREASWDEALDYAAQLIKDTAEKHGARSLSSYYGRGVLGMPIMAYGIAPQSPLYRLGSPNDTSCGSICNLASSTMAPQTVLGLGVRQMVPDVENSDLVIVWGKNSATDDGPQVMLARIKAAQERGAKVIVIDPRESGVGEIADWWIPILPGGDGAFACALLKIIIEDKLYDQAFVDEYVQGLEEYANYLQGLSLDTLSKQCGVSVDDMRRFVSEFTATTKACLIAYTGLEYALTATQANRALYVLWGIAGKLDTEGGMYLNCKGVPTFQLAPAPEGEMPLGYDEAPLFYGFCRQGHFMNFPKAVLEDDPYPVRGLLVVGGSPATSFPESDTWRKAYQKLDCMIVLDRFFTEDSRFADVVFPVTSVYESIKIVPSEEGRNLREPLIDPVGESREDCLIMGELAWRLGVGEGLPRTTEELRDWLLTTPIPFAGDFVIRKGVAEREYRKFESGSLRADGKPGFPTPSGKLEICSTLLAESGVTAYPEYIDVRTLDGMDEQTYPMLMTRGSRSNNRMGCLGANFPQITRIEPEPLVEICAEDARRLGVEDGGRVRVTTPTSQVEFTAKVCGVAPGGIHIPHGGGSAFDNDAWREGGVNALNSLSTRDSISGFPAFKAVPCRVEAL